MAEISLKIGSGATPTGGQASYLAERRRWAFVRSQNVFDRHFSDEGLAYISDEQAERLAGACLQEGDILLNITGDGVTFGRACEVPKAALPAVVNQHVSIIRVNPQLADEGFLLSYLTHPDVKHYMESFNTGGSRRAITKAHIGSFEVPLPPRPVQRAVSRILGALDDKIELNRQMNRTLEAIAAAIFKSWFVDFDPVVAKAEGRAPFGMSAEIVARFPSSFEESALGPIPKGWRVGPFVSGVDILNGGTPRTSVAEYWRGEIPWYSVTDAPTPSDVYVVDTEKHVTPLGVAQSATQVLDVDTTIISARGTVGRLALVGTPMAMNQSCYALSSRPPFAPLYLFFATKASVDTLRQRSYGTVFDTITRKTLESLEVVLPAPPCIEAFEDMAKPLLQRVLGNVKESRTLSDLRGLLLPKLLSGELRVSQAEKALVGV